MRKTLLLAAVFVLMVSLPAFVSAVSDDEAKALFEAKCNLCHSATNATDMRETPDGWRAIVLRMKNDNGCDLSDAQVETITNYLSRHYGR
ncbi:MAG: hypothetical protein KAR83_04775 [Thermodesulfovibrionales bacterium]|nr:hypothetical protein [Thermodesulfovibrionales bacterium]